MKQLVTLRIKNKTKTYIYLHNDDTCHCLMPHQGDISSWLPHFCNLIGPAYTLTTASFYCLYWPILVSRVDMECWWTEWMSESESLSHVQLFATSWTIQSMEFSRPEYWSGWPFPSPEDLPNPGIKPRSQALHAAMRACSSLPTELSGTLWEKAE